jgi:cytochrome oxidase Cu insertion factor (SCO1/SenC/PrrC family)
MSDPEAALRARNLRTLALLAALFLLPLLLAFCTYYGSSWRPAGSVNHGVLIQPPRPLPALQLAPATPDSPAPNAAGLFRGQWSLVYVGDGACEAACRETLYVMRQTRLALNNDMTRVARVFLVTAHCCAPGLSQEHAGLVLLNAQEAAAAPLLQQFPPLQREHTLFIVDPRGNLMMSYDARQNPRGLLEDLKKLLRLSHIG